MSYAARLLDEALAAGADRGREKPVVMGMPVIATRIPPYDDIELRFNLSEYRDSFSDATLGELCHRHGKGPPYFSAVISQMDMKLTRDIDALMGQVVKNAERSAQGMMAQLLRKQTPMPPSMWTDTIDATAFGDSIRQRIPVKSVYRGGEGDFPQIGYEYKSHASKGPTTLDPELENRLYRKHREAERKQREAEERRRVEEMADEIAFQEELECHDLYGEWA